MIPARRSLLSRWMLGLTACLSCTTQSVAASQTIDGVLILDPARRAQILSLRQKKAPIAPTSQALRPCPVGSMGWYIAAAAKMPTG